MAYKVVYYDDIRRVNTNTDKKLNEWIIGLDIISKNINEISNSNQYKGQAAESVKNYLEQIHGTLYLIIRNVLNTYMHQFATYYWGYRNCVDFGNGDELGINKTMIVFDEVNGEGSIINEIKHLIDMSNSVTSDVKNVKNSISDIAYIASAPRNSELILQLNSAIGKAISANEKVIKFEESRKNDFVEIDRLILHAQSIIDNQIGNNRIPVIDYKSGAIESMCDISGLKLDLKATEEIVKKIKESADYDNIMELAFNSDEIIKDAERKSREWVQWVAVGVAVVGSITVIVVTAGAAAPGVCAIAGAVSAGVGTAAGKFADNYVETGDFVKGMDWNSFAKDVVTSSAVGFVSGYMGAISQGSAIKQPISKAIYSCSSKAAEEVTKGLIDITWDIGEGIITKKPIEEIINNAEQNTNEMIRNITVEGTKAFVGGYVSQSYKVGTSEKGYLQKVEEKIVEGVLKEGVGGGINLAWDVGEAVLDSNSSENIESILKRNSKDMAGKISKSVTQAFISEISELVPDGNSDKKLLKTGVDIIADTGGDVMGDVAKGVSERSLDYLYGDEEDNSKILDDIWEKDLDAGRGIVKSAIENAKENIVEDVNKEFYNKLRKVDYDKDGKVEIVKVGDYYVTKEDYDAAIENAGKGAYKNYTAQDILGLPKNEDLTSVKTRTKSIEMLEKYKDTRKTIDTVTIDGKYTYRKSYYDSVIDMTGEEGYTGKSAQDMLGIPNDVNISEENTTLKRVKKDENGNEKKYEFKRDFETVATKIHVTNMKYKQN